MISQRWRYASLKRLVKTVDIRGEDGLRSWIAIEKEVKNHWNQIRSFSCPASASGDNASYIKTVLHDQLPQFSGLRHLGLYSGSMPLWTVAHLKFKNSLTSLTLTKCRASIYELAMLLNGFPQLDQLDLHNLRDKTGDNGTAPPSRSPRKLSIVDVGHRGPALLSGVFATLLKCREVTLNINHSGVSVQEFIKNLKRVERLDLKRTVECMLL